MGRKERGPGVCLCRRPAKVGRWYVGVNEKQGGGKWVTRWIATGTHDEEKARREFYEPALAVVEGRRSREVAERVMAATGVVAKRIEVALSGLWKFYEEHAQEKASEDTERTRRNRVVAFVAWMAKRHPEMKALREVSTRVVGEFWKELEERKLSPATRNTWKAMLGMVWKQLMVPAELEDNPWDKLVNDRGGGTSYRVLELAEVRRLIEAARTFDSRAPGFWPVAIQMGLETGLREGTIAGLKGTDLDWEGEVLAVKERKTERKTKGKLVTYHSLNRPWVQELPRVIGDAPLWPRAAEVAHAQGERWLCDEFKAICHLAGIRTERDPEPGERRQQKVLLVSFHSLRHSYATHLLRSGKIKHADLVAQGTWANESTPRKVYDDAKREQGMRASLAVAEAWEKVLGE